VYLLVTKCFYSKKSFEAYEQLFIFRKKLLKNKSTLEITDFGSGSKKFKDDIRKISDLTKHVSITCKNAKLLFRLVNYLNPNNILELGTSLGFATQAMSLANPEAEITTIEGCPNISAFAKEEFLEQELKNVNLITGDFSKVIPTLKHPQFDLVYFDGNHSKEATLKYFDMLLPKAHNDSVFIFDDIYWSKGMTEAWEIIKMHPQITVTIDTFSWGIVFFRTEQAKEHFTIRVYMFRCLDV
jgi:predicted O-methyltransferase YrrM